MRLQRNATGALLNRTQSDENRQQLVNAVAISVIVGLQLSRHEIQYYCTTALSNFAVDGSAFFSSRPKTFSYWCITANNRKKLLNTKSKLVQNLITLMDSLSLKVQCQAALALRNLTSAWFIHSLLNSYDSTTEKSQTEIVKSGGLPPLLRFFAPSIIVPTSYPLLCDLRLHPSVNEFSIIESGFLHLLIDLLAYKENEEIQCHAISTLHNLAASSRKNKSGMVEAGALDKIK
ncbi:ARM repeat-containing protein [Atractiella rhizophila]|nr:ARM repeat-containing protein [Atractiella rhizophila]